jgi:integrase
MVVCSFDCQGLPACAGFFIPLPMLHPNRMVNMATVTKRKWTNKSGTHEAWVLAHTDARTGERIKQQFPTKRAADARRIEVEGQMASGAFRAAATKATVADACQNYLDHLKARHLRDAKVTTTYLETNRGEVWNYIAQELRPEGHDKTASRVTPFDKGVGHFRLAQFTPADVADWTERLLAAGVSVPTTRRLVASLSRALAYAVSKNLVGVNAAKGVKVIGSRKTDGPKKVTPPSKSDLRTLLEAAEPTLYIKILFAAASGLRASEQWALRWRDLDLQSGKVNVEKRLDIHGQLDTTKSAAGQRTVPIGISVVTAMLKWRDSGIKSGPDDIVFPNSEGGYTRHGNLLKREFDPFKVEVGLPALTWHALRHYAVSTWIEAGLKPKVVQTFAGHATLSITMDRYGHLFPSDDHGAAFDKIAETLLM